MSADLHKAIIGSWNAATGLNKSFQEFWSADDKTRYNVLHEQKATPGNAFPYCVYEISGGTPTGWQSGDNKCVHAQHEIPGQFKVYAKPVSIDSRKRKGKTIAADLAGHIKERFGGHPTAQPHTFEMDHGQHLLTEYLTDFSIKDDDDVHAWVIQYMFKIDVPIAI